MAISRDCFSGLRQTSLAADSGYFLGFYPRKKHYDLAIFRLPGNTCGAFLKGNR